MQTLFQQHKICSLLISIFSSIAMRYPNVGLKWILWMIWNMAGLPILISSKERVSQILHLFICGTWASFSQSGDVSRIFAQLHCKPPQKYNIQKWLFIKINIVHIRHINHGTPYTSILYIYLRNTYLCQRQGGLTVGQNNDDIENAILSKKVQWSRRSNMLLWGESNMY